MKNPSLEDQLKTIAAAPIQAEWLDNPRNQNGTEVNLSLPHGCRFGSNAFMFKQPRYVEAGNLRVPAIELRGHGIGARLTRGLGTLARYHGMTALTASVASQYSLDIFGQVFGVDRLRFHGTNQITSQTIEIPMDFRLARTILVAAEAIESDLEYRNLAIVTEVDLQGLDTAGWELPAPVRMP